MAAATPRQVSYIQALLSERKLTLGTGQTVDQLKEQATTLTKEQASAWIGRLKGLPRLAQQRNGGSPGYEPPSGMYKLGDEIVRVYLGQQSGRQLAKRLVADHNGEHSWEYMGQASRFVKPDSERLSLEEAKAFGRMTGTCCVCARRLDVPESVEAGIGPVCAGRMAEGRWS